MCYEKELCTENLKMRLSHSFFKRHHLIEHNKKDNEIFGQYHLQNDNILSSNITIFVFCCIKLYFFVITKQTFCQTILV